MRGVFLFSSVHEGLDFAFMPYNCVQLQLMYGSFCESFQSARHLLLPHALHCEDCVVKVRVQLASGLCSEVFLSLAEM